MNVYRIHIRPYSGSGNPEQSAQSFGYCKENQVLGVGWEIDTQDNKVLWEEYEKKARQRYGKNNLSSVRYLKNNVHQNDLLWTRDVKGNYYLAKVLSGWEYLVDKKALAASITNVVKCEIRKVPSIDDVPGKVVACFRPSRTIQRISEHHAEEYSRLLWNELSQSSDYKIDTKGMNNIFTFLDDIQTEDVVFIYLQTKGWFVVPSSRKRDTMNYEFYLIHKENYRRAVVQVKTGQERLDARDWKGRDEHVFLFQANNEYENMDTVTSNVTCISPAEIATFIDSNLDLMPENITRWAKFVQKNQKAAKTE